MEGSSLDFWLKIDAVVGAVIGVLLYIFPHALTGLALHFEGEGVQWHLVRCCGGQMIAEAFFFWRIASSVSSEAKTSCLYTRFATSALLTATILHARVFFIKHFNGWYFAICLLLLAISIGGNVYHLIVSGAPLGSQNHLQSPSSKVPSHLMALPHMDSLAAFLIGAAWMCFPEWILKRQVKVLLNGSHIFFGRCMGAYFICSHFLTAHSFYWSDISDWRGWLYGRTIMCGGIFLAQLWSQIAYHDWWTSGHWVGIGLYSIWTALSLWTAQQTFSGKLLAEKTE